jgi:osmotically-inducible protein OsmY
MITDKQLQHDVLNELEWEPSVTSSNIGVAAKAGVVTLTGHVPRFSEKIEAERVAKGVLGVKAVANDIEIHLPGSSERDDTDIAEAAVSALKWNSSVPADKVKVTVRNGWLTLEGEVEWQFQRQAAVSAVTYLQGVKQVVNKITLTPRPQPKDIKAKIEAAFKRRAEIDAGHVMVDAYGSTVTLKGKVDSWGEYSEAERVAWSMPGVMTVDNDLTVGV